MKSLRNIMLTLALSYVGLIIFSQILSMYSVDEMFSQQIKTRMKELGCDQSYPHKDVAVLNPITFYFNMDYWLADYRIPLSVTKDQKCVQEVIVQVENYKRATSVVLVDSNAHAVIKIKKR